MQLREKIIFKHNVDEIEVVGFKVFMHWDINSHFRVFLLTQDGCSAFNLLAT